MRVRLKSIWIAAVIVVSLFFLGTYIGATDFFNDSAGIEWTFYFALIGVPIMIFVVISIYLLALKWAPRNDAVPGIVVYVFIAISGLAILAAPFPMRTERRLTESVSTHGLIQTTEDGKYEYTLEVINSSLKNCGARLYIKNVNTGEEARIPLDMGNAIISIRGGGGSEKSAWSYLVPSEVSPSTYILITTTWINKASESFEIDMETMTSRRIE